MYRHFAIFSTLTLLATCGQSALSMAAGFDAQGGSQRFDSSVPVIGIFEDSPPPPGTAFDRSGVAPIPGTEAFPVAPSGPGEWPRPYSGAASGDRIGGFAEQERAPTSGMRMPPAGARAMAPWSTLDEAGTYGSAPYPPGQWPGARSSQAPSWMPPQGGGFGGGMGPRSSLGLLQPRLTEGSPGESFWAPEGRFTPEFSDMGPMPQGFPGRMPMPPVPFGAYPTDDPWLATMERYVDLEERLIRIERLLEQILANQNSAPEVEPPPGN